MRTRRLRAPRRDIAGAQRWRRAAVLALAALGAALAIGCYSPRTGAVRVPGVARFTLPAFPQSGSNAVEVFTEMHYAPSYRFQEAPRLLPPPYSVPITGKGIASASLAEFSGLRAPPSATETYDSVRAQEVFRVNCAVCHGSDLSGGGPIRQYMKRGPFPADLTGDLTRSATDGELFGFISRGGRQGQAALERGLASRSPMPEFDRLLTEEERWLLVLYLRAAGGGR